MSMIYNALAALLLRVRFVELTDIPLATGTDNNLINMWMSTMPVLYLLGMMYLEGGEHMNIKKDVGKAIELLQRASDLGSAPAYVCLVLMYGEGLGVSKDGAKAKLYREKGAMAGCRLCAFET